MKHLSEGWNPVLRQSRNKVVSMKSSDRLRDRAVFTSGKEDSIYGMIGSPQNGCVFGGEKKKVPNSLPTNSKSFYSV
jgi:hypothetical protein